LKKDNCESNMANKCAPGRKNSDSNN
jgi:hypothetical protein